MKRKLICVVLSIVLILSVTPTFVLAQSKEFPKHLIENEQDKLDIGGVEYTVLRTKDDFLGISEGYYIFANDIDFYDTQFTSYPVTLTGDTVINGNGYSLKNFAVYSNSHASIFATNAALFHVSNLTIGTELKKVQIHSNGSNFSAGAFLGLVEQDCSVTIKNTVVHADVSTSGDTAKPAGFIGSSTIAGTLEWEIIDCDMYGSVKGNGTLGTKNSYGGGFLGEVTNKPLTIKGCRNFATIEGPRYASGIIGRYATKTALIEDCINYADVTGPGAVSGIIGQLSGTITVKNCINAGNLVGKDNSGGIMAALFSFEIKAENCVNIGSLTVDHTNTAKYSAGIAGYLQANAGTAKYTFTNCASFGPVSATSGAVACILRGSLNNEEKVTAAIKEISGTKYISQNDVNLNSTNLNEAVSIAEAFTYLESVFPDINFKIAENENLYIVIEDAPTVVKYPLFVGLQNTAADIDKKQSIRFIAVIDSLNYSKVGFEVSVSYTDPESGQVANAVKTLECSHVFTSLLGMEEDGTSITYTSDDLGGAYIFALAFTLVPTDVGDVTFTVSAFADSCQSVSYTLVYNNGTFASIVEQ